MGHTYLIHFGVYFVNARYSSHKMKVKNSLSELHAKIKLEDYLKRKHPDFSHMVVYSCARDFDSIFGNAFGAHNPFNKWK